MPKPYQPASIHMAPPEEDNTPLPKSLVSPQEYDLEQPRYEILISWMLPTAGWIFIGLNTAIASITIWKMALSDYNWLTHLSLVLNTSMSIAVLASAYRFVLRYKDYGNIRRNN